MAKVGRKSPNAAGTIKLDKSRPYVRTESTFPLREGAEDLGPARQKLTEALAEAWRAYRGRADNGREGVRMGLAAALQFVEAVDPQSGEMFDRFLTVLIAALSDLDKGITAPLLKPGARDIQNPDSFARKDIRRRAVATMAALMDARYNRDDAAEKVTAVLAENGFHVTVITLKRWYDERLPAEVKQRKGRPPKSVSGGRDRDAQHQLDARLHYVTTAHQGADTMLNELAWFVRLWFPSGE
jgi:hypothetical protein